MREAYTVFDAISQTGGMMGVIVAIVQFLIGDLQKFLFFKEWAHHSFVVQKKKKVESFTPGDSRSNNEIRSFKFSEIACRNSDK